MREKPEAAGKRWVTKEQKKCILQRTPSGSGEVAGQTGQGGGGSQREVIRPLGKRRDICHASRQGAEQAVCHVE